MAFDPATQVAALADLGPEAANYHPELSDAARRVSHNSLEATVT